MLKTSCSKKHAIIIWNVAMTSAPYPSGLFHPLKCMQINSYFLKNSHRCLTVMMQNMPSIFSKSWACLYDKGYGVSSMPRALCQESVHLLPYIQSVQKVLLFSVLNGWKTEAKRSQVTFLRSSTVRKWVSWCLNFTRSHSKDKSVFCRQIYYNVLEKEKW